MEELIKEESLGDILRKYDIITDDDVCKALEEQRRTGCRFGEALVAMGIVTAEDIDWALANQLNIPYVRLKADLISHEAAGSISQPLARKYDLVPLVRAGDELRIAMADPLNSAAIEAVEAASGCRVSVAIALKREIREMHDLIYGYPTEGVVGFSSHWLPEVVEAINGDPTGETLLDHLFQVALQNGFTSVSLQRCGEEIVITVQNGGRREGGRFSAAAFPSLIKTLKEKVSFSEERSHSQSGIICLKKRDGGAADVQVLMLQTTEGPFVTIKPLVPLPFPSTVDELQCPPQKLGLLREITSNRRGMIIVSTRNGKERARFMELLLSELDLCDKKTFLLGDELARGNAPFPKLARQSLPVNEMLQAVLDHNPDVIAVEDLSDHHSMMVACSAAMRGKLILGGLPCHGPFHTLKSLHHAWHRNYLIPACLRGIIACASVPLLCPQCRQEQNLTDEEMRILGIVTTGQVSAPRGCSSCGMTGYAGKRYLTEIIPFNEQFRRLFETAEGDKMADLMAGDHDLVAEGRGLLARGEISPMDYIEYILH